MFKKKSFKVKAAFHRKILDIVEMLPRFYGGRIGELQAIREWQRKRSETMFTMRQFPTDADLKFANFRLIEVFDIEHFDGFAAGLKQLFPHVDKVHNLVNEYRQNVGSFSGGSWAFMGVITRTRLMIPREQRCVEDLPKFVKSIDVSAHQVLPSLYAVSFDVHLSDDFSEKLKVVMNRPYLPDIEFYGLLPFGRRRGYTQSAPDITAQRAYLAVIDHIVADVLKWLAKHIQGFYLATKARRDSRHRPIIEVFHLQGNPKEPDKFKEWTKQHTHWLHYIELALNDRASFNCGGIWFLWPTKGYSGDQIPYRFVICETENNQAVERFHYELDSLTSYMAVHEYITAIQYEIEQRRHATFSKLARLRLAVSRQEVKKTLHATSSLMVLERTKLELQDNMSWFGHIMEDLNDFKSADEIFGGRSLDRVLTEHLTSKINEIQKQVALIREAQSAFLEIQNSYVMFKLQRRMYWLTWVMLLAAIVGAFVAIPSILSMWARVKGVLLNL